MKTIALLALLTIAGCPPRVEPQPMPVGSEDCGSACAALRALQCPEGATSLISGEACERVCVRALELRPLPLACWTSAPDVAAARACGSLRCVR